MADTHVTSGSITIGSGLSLVGSGMNVITSVSGNTVSLTPGTTVQLAPAGVFVMSGQVNTSVSGNVVNISGQPVQTSISGNIIQTSISGNAISISGDILLTSFSGNVINVINQGVTPLSNWIAQAANFILTENQSGGVGLPDLGTFPSGIILTFIPSTANQYSGIPLPSVYYGGSGSNAPYITSQTSGISPSVKYIGTINVQGYPGALAGNSPGTNIFPFTSTKQINVVTSGGSGLALFYAGWQ